MPATSYVESVSESERKGEQSCLRTSSMNLVIHRARSSLLSLVKGGIAVPVSSERLSRQAQNSRTYAVLSVLPCFGGHSSFLGTLNLFVSDRRCKAPSFGWLLVFERLLCFKKQRVGQQRVRLGGAGKGLALRRVL